MTENALPLDPSAFDEIQRLVAQVGQQAVIQIGDGPTPSGVRSWVTRADAEAQSVGLEPTRGRLRPVRKFAAKLVWPTVAKSVDATRSVNRAVEMLSDEVNSNRTQLETQLEECNDHIASILESLGQAERRIKHLELVGLRSAHPGGSTSVANDASTAATPDGSFYLAFENEFRGTRAEIAELVSAYLPDVIHLVGGELPVVDVGCGRGEWLQVLREAGIPAHGVDTLDTVVEQCRALGLDVRHEDAVRHLDALPPGTAGAVTAFHLVEHLPFDVLLRFLLAAKQALNPAGILILETPNPTNVVVGAASFWTDPSHIRPMHPDLLRFAVEYVGFQHAQVTFLHPSPNTVDGAEDDLNGLERLAAWSLDGPRDFAVIARRVGDDG